MIGFGAISLLILLLLFPAPASGCMWDYDIDGSRIPHIEPGMELSGNDFTIERLLEGDRSVVSGRLSALASDSLILAHRMRADASYKARNNYAVNLLRLGHFGEGLRLLLAIEEDHPGLYETASNIGSACELMGRNADALHWIREGLRRNPRSHHGSEWIHVRILEAKLAMETYPEWLKDHTILGLDFGSDSLPDRYTIPGGHPAEGRTIQEIREAILYQLHERLWFATPPDPITADLLADLATVTLITHSARDAMRLYNVALSYRPADSALLLKRIAGVRSLLDEQPGLLYLDEIPWRDEGAVGAPLLVGGPLSLAALLAGAWLYRRRRERSLPDV